MIKRHKLLVAAAALIAAAFIGCSMMDGGTISSSSDSQKTTDSLTRTLSGVIDNIQDYDASFAMTRTIAPSIDTTTYEYWLYGKTIVGTNEIGPKKLTVSAPAAATSTQDVGTFTEEVAAAAWDLTLVAIDASKTVTPTAATILDNASLVAYAYTDLTKASSGTSFHLVSDNLPGTGNVSIKVKLSNDNGATSWSVPTSPAATKVYIYLENIITGELVSGNKETGDSAVSYSAGVYPFSATSVNPGTYNLVVCFKSGDSTPVCSYWSDVLVVLPMRNTNQTVYVPNIIGTKPAKPASLNATYIESSLDFSGHEGFYTVKFEWDGSAVTNERYFEFEILDVTDKTAPTPYLSDWETSTLAGKKYSDPNDFYAGDERAGGSLIRNNSEIRMWLPMGKAYWARICSVNKVGKSDWTYLTLKDASADPLYPPAGEKLFAVNGSNAESVNLSKITYIKNGGSSIDSTGSSNKIDYFVVDKMDVTSRSIVPLWPANTDDVNLKRGEDSFVGWTTNGTTATMVYKAFTKDSDDSDHGKAGTISGVNGFVTTKKANITAIKTLYADAAATPTDVAGVTAEDKGGFNGFGPLTLYADFTGNLKGNVTLVDMAYEYRLCTDWIMYGKSSADTPVSDGLTNKKLYESGSFDWSKSAKGNAIKLCVKLPKKGEYTISTAGGDKTYKLNLDPADTSDTSTVNVKPECTATIKDANGRIKHVAKTTVSAFFSEANFAPDINVQNWENGAYTIYIDSVVKTLGQTITRSVSVTMNITD